LSEQYFKVKGLGYYQGEQNAGCGGPPQIDYYYCALPSLIADYRARLGQPSVPFGAVLLAAWAASTPYFPQIRLAVTATVATVPNTFSISALDRGDPAGGPVHSPYKQDVGRRAALGFLALSYGLADVAYKGPKATGATQGPGGGVLVSFDPATLYGQALTLNTSVACPSTIPAPSCEAFAVQTSDCVWWPNVTASLAGAGSQLLLQLPGGVPGGVHPVATRGMYANWPLVQVYNGPGLPVDPWVLNVTGVVNPCPGILGRGAATDPSPGVASLVQELGMDLRVYA
jgi:hypothetical protein